MILNFLKNCFKKLISSFRIPSLVDFIFKSRKEALANAEPASQNWARLGLEKYWKLFASIFLVIVLAAKSYIISFILTLKSRIDILNYEGSSSPLTIVYKANAAIALIDQVFTLAAWLIICYLTYSFFKDEGK